MQVASRMQKLWEKKSVKIFFAAVLFRLLLYAAYVCMMAILSDYQSPILFSDFLDGLKRWDGSAYIRIARDGYRGYQENGQFLDIVFFPLYPWLIRLVAFVVRDYLLAGSLVSTICFAIGMVYLYHLVSLEYGEETAENTCSALAVFPFAFFFGFIMTESLFFAVLSAFFYYLRKHNWKAVAAAGFLACMTKVQGMLLTLAVIVELFYSYHGILLIRQKKWKEFGKKIILQGLQCVPMVFGLLVYLFMNYVIEGDPFRFLYYQKNHWANGLAPIWKTVLYVAQNAAGSWFTSTGMGMWVPELVLFFLYLAVIGYGFKKKLHPAYMTYLISFFILTYSSSWLISGGRYTLSALPFFILEGKFITEHKKAGGLVMAFSFALMMIYMAGCYQWKQIM